MADKSSSIQGFSNVPGSLGDITSQSAQEVQKVLQRVGIEGISTSKGDSSGAQQEVASSAPQLASPLVKAVFSKNSFSAIINLANSQKVTLESIENASKAAITNIRGTQAVGQSQTEANIKQIQANLQAQQNAGKSGHVGKILSWVAIGVAAVVAVAGVVGAVFTGGSSLAIAGAVLALMAVGVMAFMQTGAGQDTKNWVADQVNKLISDPTFGKIIGDLTAALTFGLVSSSSTANFLQDHSQEIAKVIVGLAVVGLELALVITGAGLTSAGVKAAQATAKAAEAATKGVAKAATWIERAAAGAQKAVASAQVIGGVAGGTVGVASGVNAGVGTYWNYEASTSGADSAQTQALLNLLTKIAGNGGEFIKELEKIFSSMINNMTTTIANYMDSTGKIAQNISA